MPFFVIRYPEKQKTWGVRVNASRFSIGRGQGATIRLPHSSISKEHVRFECHGARCVLHDLGSHNGVMVNGIRVEHSSLSDGDVLQLGPFELSYSLDAPAGAVSKQAKHSGAPAVSDPSNGGAAPSGAPAVKPAKRKTKAPRRPDSSDDTTRHFVGRASGDTTKRVVERASGDTTKHVVERASGDTTKQVAGGTSGDTTEHVVGKTDSRTRRHAVAAGSTPPGRSQQRAGPSAEGTTSERIDSPEIVATPRPAWSPALLLMLALVFIVLGISLGHLSSWLDGDHPDGDPDVGESAAAPAGAQGGPISDESPAREAGRRRRRPANPLGAPVALEDIVPWRVSLVRLWLDARNRPPLPSELLQTSLLSLEDRWVELAGDGFGEGLQGLEPADVFKRMLRRAPTATELKALSELARDDVEHLAFLLASSREYTSPRAPRPRGRKRLARSLHVDLVGRVPTRAEEDRLDKELEGAEEKIDAIVDRLTKSEDSRAGPRPGENEVFWVRGVYLRMLLREPTDEEARAGQAALRHGEEGWRFLLGNVARRPEYASY